MSYTFGFDLGTNSIGWSVVDKQAEKIKGLGSVVFPMGVNLENGKKEVPKNETRREKRHSRRQYFRRGIRKAKLAEKLSEKGLFPDIKALYEKYIPDGKQTKFPYQFQQLIRQTPLCPELNDFFTLDPYEARALAYKGEKVTSLQLGRLLYQMGLRRGYRETLQDEDEKGVIYSGKPIDGRTGINETLQKIEEFGTLGNYLQNENPHKTRLRNRYTLRSMYTKEFDLIFENQQKFFPEILTEEFYQELGFRHPTDSQKNGILFYQRPLRSQKHLLGNCQFETDKPVAPKSCPDFERYRAWTYATNIRLNGEMLSADDQIATVEYILEQNTSKYFSDLRKKLSDPAANFNYDDKERLPSSPTLAGLKKVFKKQWKAFSEKEVEDLWHLKYWAKDPDWLQSHLKSKYNLTDDEITRFKKIKLVDGYGGLSRKAMKAITQFMSKGYGYDEAVLLAGIERAMGKNWNTLSDDERITIEDTAITMAKDGTTGPAIDRIREFLREHKGVTDKELNKLYHHSFKSQTQNSKYLPEPENVRNPIVQQAMYILRNLYNTLVDEYGAPKEVKVELARDLKGSKKERDKMRDMNRKRRDVNIEIKKVLDQYNQPHSRDNIQKVQLFNEIKNRYGRAVNPFKPEQSIGIADLFGTGSVQIEHIIPQSKSLNNSLGNKTLCDADTNRKKGNRTPFEYFKSIGADWEGIKKQIFDILPYQKAKRFIEEKNPDADDFISRQLNDTRYISRYAVTYLKNACKDVDIMQGTVSAMLRHYWGLDGILSPALHLDVENGEYFVAVDEEGEVVDYRKWEAKNVKKHEEELSKKGKVLNGNAIHGKFYPRKDRNDHRHHAIDALVVALAQRKHLQQLSTAHAREVDFRTMRSEGEHIVEEPWEHFWTHTRRAVDNILVYHKQNNRVLTKIKKRLYDHKGNPRKVNGKQIFAEGYAARGSLHQESVYGLHENKQGEKGFHIRKSVDFIQTHKHLAKVVDNGVRNAIKQRLEDVGLDVDNPKGWKLTDLDAETRKTIFFEALEDGTPVPKVFLPNKNGDPVPIRKVRIREEIGNAKALKDGINQYVNPKNNHHIMLYADAEGNIHEEVVTFWTAVERARNRQPVYSCPDNCEPWFSMEENDLFLLGLSDRDVLNWHELDNQYLNNHLYRVQKLSSSYYVFRLHSATSLDFDSEMRRYQSMGAFKNDNPIKVKLTITGKIEAW